MATYPSRVITMVTEGTILPSGVLPMDSGIALTVLTDRSLQCSGERVVMNPPKAILTVTARSTLLSFDLRQVFGIACRAQTEPFKQPSGVPTTMYQLSEITMLMEETISECF